MSEIDDEISYIISEEKRTRNYAPNEKMLLSDKEVFAIRTDFGKRFSQSGLLYLWESFLDSYLKDFRTISVDSIAHGGDMESLTLGNLPEYRLLAKLYKNIDGEFLITAKYSSAVKQFVKIVENVTNSLETNNQHSHQ